MNKLLSTTALMLTLAWSGAAYAHEDGPGGKEGPPPFMEETLSKLPQKDADAFRETMKSSHEKDKPLFEEMHKKEDELKGILTADKFDKGAYLAKSKELDKLHEKMHAGMTEAFASAVSALPVDERKTLAEGMHHGPHEHHGHHHMHGKDGDDKGKPGDDKPAGDAPPPSGQ